MWAENFLHAVGYRRHTQRDRSASAVRADVLGRPAREAYKLAAAKPPAEEQCDGFAAEPALCQLADCDAADLEALLFALGYRRHGSAEGQPRFRRKGARHKVPGSKPAAAAPEAAGATETSARDRKSTRLNSSH